MMAMEWILPSFDASLLQHPFPASLMTNGRHNSTADSRLNLFDPDEVRTLLAIAVSNAVNCFPYKFRDPGLGECVPVGSSASPSPSPSYDRPPTRKKGGRNGRKLKFKFLERFLTEEDSDEVAKDRNVAGYPGTTARDDPGRGYVRNGGGWGAGRVETFGPAPIGASTAERRRGASAEVLLTNKLKKKKKNKGSGDGGDAPAEDRSSSYGGGSSYSAPKASYGLGGYWGMKQPNGGCYCAIGNDDGKAGKSGGLSGSWLAWSIPLAIFAVLFSTVIGAALAYVIGQIVNGNNTGRIASIFSLRRGKRDLANELEFIDENEIVLRMLDDLMMTYKYGYIPKCSDYHICKLNKAAAFGGSPQSTVIPLVSLPAAFILGKPTSKVMDYLHAVWLGRNERDCDEAFPECSDAHVSQSDASLKGGSFSSSSTTSAKPPLLSRFGNSTSTVGDEIGGDVDAILKDLRFLEENASKSTSPPTPTPTPGSSSTAASGTTPFNSM